MKVICVQDKNQDGNKTQLTVGETYTASQCSVYPGNYDIHELPMWNGRAVSYRKYCFIPLSTIDETEMERNYNLQTL